MNFKNMNESAVSPIVATLVLIVVAVVGAVAVGTIMGTFSSDVAEQTNTGDVAGASASEILIAGSTTVQPASELLAKAYMNQHSGIKITVQAGGSDAGIAGVGMGICDIGSASKDVSSAYLEEYPNLNTYQIGGSGVVFIHNDVGALAGITGATAEGLKNLYDIANAQGYVAYTDDGDNIINAADTFAEGTGITTDVRVYQRAEGSGTEEAVDKYIDDKGYMDTTTAAGAQGNELLFQSVSGSTNPALGFVDWAFAGDGVVKLDLDTYTTSEDDIKNALMGQDTYPTDLARPLNYIVNGEPNSVVKNYIEFAQSPAGAELVKDAGFFPLLDLKKL
ncbi:MAG: phosphate transport system substrate-binding protein [Methanoculleus sp.]|nr:phosphate transport system substrate-binding protein [Methanoculleus sp.]